MNKIKSQNIYKDWENSRQDISKLPYGSKYTLKQQYLEQILLLKDEVIGYIYCRNFYHKYKFIRLRKILDEKN